ncbi:hypothetical protein GCM10025876_24070 [Demequina litorisediminis]|uniref:Uncharacterized protein n=1 Tax=Demequina litorisediminis TaxID=1849022 RepID=A0ABQ6IEA6_9MICO|nr:hypothetical protein GCM10025876_24070 [Demequina litorisediminis]
MGFTRLGLQRLERLASLLLAVVTQPSFEDAYGLVGDIGVAIDDDVDLASRLRDIHGGVNP